MNKSREVGEHVFYHLLSGVDLPLKPIESINEFYELNSNKIFLSYSNKENCMKHYELRLKYRQYFRDKCGRSKNIFTIFNKLGVWAQKPFVKRGPIDQDEFYFGSTWWDLPQDVVDYIIKNESKIKMIYKYGSCCDEAFIHSIVWNNENLRKRLYVPKLNNGMRGNMRYIDMERGVKSGAYVIQPNDIVDVLNSDMMFARKFDYDKYPETVNSVVFAIRRKEKLLYENHQV